MLLTGVLLFVFASIILFGVIFRTSGFYIISVSIVVLALLRWSFILAWTKTRIGCGPFLFSMVFVFYAFFMAFLEDTVEEIRQGYWIHFPNDQRNIVLALQGYRKQYGHFPPAVVLGPKGEPLYSWRVLILPFMGEEELHRKFHLDEPWDSKENIKLLSKIPGRFQPRERDIVDSPYSTFHQALVGPGAKLLREGALEFTNDLPSEEDRVFVLLEAFEAVPWTSPRDLTLDANGTIPKLGRPRKSHLGRIIWEGARVQPNWFSAAWAEGELGDCVEQFDNPFRLLPLQEWMTRQRKGMNKE